MARHAAETRRILVLVDAHRGLGRPLCSAEDLSSAILDEVLAEDTASFKIPAFSQLFAKSSLPSKEEIRVRAAAVTKSLLAGERPPPGQLRRAVDAAADELAELAKATVADATCVLFGDASDACCSADAPAVPLSPSELSAAWMGGGASTAVPTLPAACGGAAGLRGMAAVVVLTVRSLSLGPLLDATLGPPPPVFWLHYFLEDPAAFKGIADICAQRGGEAVAVSTESDVRDALRRAFGSRRVSFSPAPRAPVPVRSQMQSTVYQAVLARAGPFLSTLEPEVRQARIRELVAEEIDSRQVKMRATNFIDKLLNQERDVEQRVLIEWYLALARMLAFCGDAVTLSRAVCVSRIWRSSLSFGGSVVARKLWKWMIRFGDPVPLHCRWAFWAWLSRRQVSARMAFSPDDFKEQLLRGRQEETLAEARAVIAADVPRTFGSSASSLLPIGLESHTENVEERRNALERVLLSFAAACPSVGYCQGLNVVAAFAISVAEEAGLCGDRLEAETFAFLVGIMQVHGLRSWMEPPLHGLQAAVKVQGRLLEEHLPELATYLASEGAAPEFLSMPWLQTLYAGFSPMPRATLCRIWECWLLDCNPKIFFRTAITIFKNCESALLSKPIDQGTHMLRTFPAPLDEGLQASLLVPAAWSVHITGRCLRSMLSDAEKLLQEEARCETLPVSHPTRLGTADTESRDDMEAVEHNIASSYSADRQAEVTDLLELA